MLNFGQMSILQGFGRNSVLPIHPKSLLILVLILFGFTSNVFSQISARVDSTAIKIGEEIMYIIEVKAEPSDIVLFPENQTFLPLEMVESYKIDTISEASKYSLIKKYGLTQFDSGHYNIPPQRILINEKAYFTDSILVQVNDVVIDTLKQKMYDIKPAMEVKKPGFNWFVILSWLLPILGLIVIILLIIRRKKRKDAAKKQLPPYEEAIVALKQLDNSELLKENKSKEYYSSLTEIVKRYLDREVDSSALESTSEELITRLMMHKDAGNFDFDLETIRKLDSIFKRADLVKFAKMNQAAGQAEVDRRSIEDIINETHEVIPEPSEEELLKNQEYLEKIEKKKKEKKWVYAISGVLAILLIGGIVYGGIAGFDNLKDKVFGNSLRELSEGSWIKSEYGHPSVILETPEVLVRTDIVGPVTDNISIRGKDVFSMGRIDSPFYIQVSTTQFKGEEEIDLEAALESVLTELEKGGAKNMLVKRDDFKTDKGVTGLKAYGEFNVQVSDKKVLKNTSTYELLIFSQQKGLQQLLIVYQDDGKYAEDIKTRIENSLEIEISEKYGK